MPAEPEVVTPGIGRPWAHLLVTLRRIAGMPDYDAYVEHLRRCHPERPILTQRQFYEAFVETRYGDGPTRCC